MILTGVFAWRHETRLPVFEIFSLQGVPPSAAVLRWGHDAANCLFRLAAAAPSAQVLVKVAVPEKIKAPWTERLCIQSGRLRATEESEETRPQVICSTGTRGYAFCVLKKVHACFSEKKYNTSPHCHKEMSDSLRINYRAVGKPAEA